MRVEVERAVSEIAKATGNAVCAWQTEFEGEPVPGLIATILKKDIDAHQGTAALKAKIRFEEVRQKSIAGRDIHIFKGILGSALKLDRDHFGGSRPSGFYQRDIRDYDRGKLSLDALQKKIEWLEL